LSSTKEGKRHEGKMLEEDENMKVNKCKKRPNKGVNLMCAQMKR
jgi:hypothetical protein